MEMLVVLVVGCCALLVVLVIGLVGILGVTRGLLELAVDPERDEGQEGPQQVPGGENGV